MILDYANAELLETPTHNIDEEGIADIVKTGIAGTHFNNVPNLNRETIRASPSLEFIAEFKPHTLTDIAKELKEARPVAVWIIVSDGVNKYVHAVVVTGMDDVKKEITYNDPTYGESITIGQSQFMSIWEPTGTRMIKIEIGRVTSRSIEEFMEGGAST